MSDTKLPSIVNLPEISLNQNLRYVHPWIYSPAVTPPKDRVPPGSVVKILTPDGRFFGYGFYNGRTRIALRVLSTDPAVVIDREFLATRLKQAIAHRQQLGLFAQTNMMRLCHSEGDRLPGLVIDLYDKTIAIQWFNAGMFRLREQIKEILNQLFPDHQLYWFAEKRLQKQESFDCWDMEPPLPSFGIENGIKFKIAVGSMHKTGFFTDQRDNRLFLSELCPGQTVLDLCSHTGGFAIYAKAKGKAYEVTAVDLDAEALNVAKANADLNDTVIKPEVADVYQWLRDAVLTKKLYDIVVLDPPKQTRSKETLDAALSQYVALNRLAMEVVKPGGILLSCSCSGLVTETDFVDTVRRAAAHSNRHAQIFRLSGAGADHPFAADAPEGRYLKAIWMRIH